MSAATAKVKISPTTVRRLRVDRSITRWVLYAVAAIGICLAVRNAVDPPKPIVQKAPRAPLVDLPAQGYAEEFADALLSYDSADPEARVKQLSAFTLDDGGISQSFEPPQEGARRVRSTTVVGQRERDDDVLYTVRALTDVDGYVYLTVPVARDGKGALSVDDYPALVGAPAAKRASSPVRTKAVEDPDLRKVTERTLRNYLGGYADDLAADLTADAEVALPPQRLTLESAEQVSWTDDTRTTVVIDAEAADAAGGSYRLAYEMDVVEDGRWFVSAIQVVPSQ